MSDFNVIVWLGFGVLAAGVACSCASLRHVMPGPSRLQLSAHADFRHRQDYTPYGWRLGTIGRWLRLAGMLLVILGILAF